MQSFTPLSFSAAEKSVTVQKTNKHTYSKLSIPHTTVWWDNNGENSTPPTAAEVTDRVHGDTVNERRQRTQPERT